MNTSPARVLVVDDNEALRDNLAEALQLEGYAVVVAANGEAALDSLAADPPPRVVLIDFKMPGMSGADLLARIRQDPRLAGVRVVMTTGSTGIRTVTESADAVLMKPFGVRELLRVLEKVGVAAP
ncbi:MAG TPA: response regulator [Anaeromyxobacter sp.]|nr:response regulator [Anaeromyxobacter sp.]